jgi:hypothetical protein
VRETLTTYFSGEKSESIVFIVCGLIAIAVSVWLWLSRNTLRGMTIPLVVIAFIQLGVGGVVFARTDQQVAALVSELEHDPAVFKTTETQRMGKVMRGFRTYKIAEIVIFALGLALAVALRKRPMPRGAGIGCMVQATVMLVCDLFAEHRGQIYLDAIRAL